VIHCIAEFLQHGMFRYRLLRTFVYFFNFLSMRFSGKPLISAGGSEKQLATNVLSWDISSTGQIVYTDGRSIYCCAADGTVATVTDSELIEKIVVLS